ncbi:MAG: M48 family metalloprotease [Acidobacteria bacterium]|nr:M48 family metalloprotease [Acidobacteriota bacterium]
MRRRMFILALLAAGIAGIWVLQHKQASTEVTPRPLLYLVADTQRELERIPLELTRVSVEEENEIGEKLARSFGQIPADTKDQETNRIRDSINEVGRRVTGGVQRPGIHYRFHYNPSGGFVNAAALPGGQIVVGRGLLQLLESEDELAAILGHEIAHVDRRHTIGRLQYELQSRKLGLGGLYQLASIGVHLFQAGYTKEQELEADRDGLRLAVAAGYSPGGALEAMKRLERLSRPASSPAVSPVEELANVPAQALQEYFRSHPPARERIRAFEAEIASNHWNPEQPRRPLAVRAIFLADEAKEFDRRGFYDKAIRRFEVALNADPKFARAKRELSLARWHSGDAAGAAASAEQALLPNPDDIATWRLFAFALAAADRKNAVNRYASDHLIKGIQKERTRLLQQAHLVGLELFVGRRGAQEDYRRMFRNTMLAETEAAMRRSVAWWMYRSGKPEDAEKELGLAWQRYPRETRTQFELAWVLSDRGRQADAVRAQSQYSKESKGGSEWLALEALIGWRTDAKDTAKTAFATAARGDPVWLQSNWAMNNYSPAAAKVFAELRDAELARRKKESLRSVASLPTAKSN